MWSYIVVFNDSLEVDDILKYYWFVNADNNHRYCLGHFSGVYTLRWFFAGIFCDILSQRLVDFFLWRQQLGLFRAMKLDKLCL